MNRLPWVAGAVSVAVLIVVALYAVALPPPMLSGLSVEVVSIAGELVEKETAVDASFVMGVLIMLAIGGMTILFFAQILQPKVRRNLPSRRRLRREIGVGSEEIP